MTSPLAASPLGKNSPYPMTYTPSLLFSIPREAKRKGLKLDDEVAFQGEDRWTAYELSWLNEYGLPQIALGEFSIPCHSPNLIESKSFKLYLNSLNQTKFRSVAELRSTLLTDLSQAAGAPVTVEITLPEDFGKELLGEFPGVCLDFLDVSIDHYQVDPSLLETAGGEVEREIFYSHLLKAQCLITNQPDWASVMINYSGPQIVPESLLKYLVSFRLHQGFHEEIIEQIFVDLMRCCDCQELTVFALFSRRGGLNISPFRSNFEQTPPQLRLLRQ